MRRLNELRTLCRQDKLDPHEQHIKSLLSRCSKDKDDRCCSQSSEPLGQSVFPGRSHSQPAFSGDRAAASGKKQRAQEAAKPANGDPDVNDVDVEEASDEYVEMDDRSKHSDAEDLFGGPSNLQSIHLLESHCKDPDAALAASLKTLQASVSDNKEKPSAKPDANKKPRAKPDASTPPITIAMASTDQSTVSSLHTASSLTGRLLIGAFAKIRQLTAWPTLCLLVARRPKTKLRNLPRPAMPQ
jgi:hypothetical protein